jgi:hypothetical protein
VHYVGHYTVSFQNAGLYNIKMQYGEIPPVEHNTSNKPTARNWLICSSPMAWQPLEGQGLISIETSLSHSATPHSVGLLWTSGRPDAVTSTWQHTTLTRDRHPCHLRDSNPHPSQQIGRLHMPCKERPLGPSNDEWGSVNYSKFGSNSQIGG